MFADGVPSGFGNVVDQHSNHYEGIVSYSVDKTGGGGKILADGVGTLYQEDVVKKGIYGKGVLTKADDPEIKTTSAVIGDF